MSKARRKKKTSKNGKGFFPSSDKPSEEEAEAKKESIKEGLASGDVVIAANKKGEDDPSSVKRVQDKHPNATVVKETEIGIPEEKHDALGTKARNVAVPPNTEMDSVDEKAEKVRAPIELLHAVPAYEVSIDKPASIMNVERTTLADNLPQSGVPMLANEMNYSPFPFSSSAPTAWTYRVTETTKQLIMEYGLKIKKFSDSDTFIEAALDLVDSVIDKYGVVLRDTGDIKRADFGRYVTAPEDVGINVYQMMDECKRDYALFAQNLSRFHIDSQPPPARVYHTDYFIDSEEAKLLTCYRRIFENIRMPLDELMAWLKNLNTNYYSIKPLHATEALSMRYFSLPWNMNLLERFLNQENAVEMRNAVWTVIASYARKFLTTTTDGAAGTAEWLLKKFSIRTTAYDEWTSIISNLSGDAAMQRLAMTMALIMYSKYAGDDYSVGDEYSPDTLVECILRTVVDPWFIYLKAARLRIRNYIAKHLVSKFNCVHPNFEIDDMSVNSEFDMMTELITNSTWQNNQLRIAVTSLWDSTRMGGGWSTGGSHTAVPLPANSGRFVNGGRDILYPRWAGRPVDADSTSYHQLDHLRVLRTAINNLTTRQKWKRSMTDINKLDIFLAILTTEIPRTLTMRCFAKDLMMSQASITSLAFPNNRILTDEEERLRIPVSSKTGDVLSEITLIDWDRTDKFTPSPTVLFSGWSVHRFFNELTFRYNYYREKLPDTFKSKAIWQKALSGIKEQPNLRRMLEEKVQNTNFKNEIVVPGMVHVPAFIREIYSAAERFIDANQQYMGFATRFYYLSNTESLVNPGTVIDKTWIYQNQAIVGYAIDSDMARRAYLTSQISDNIREIFKDHRATRFDIPINVEVKEVMQQSDIQESHPIDLGDNTNLITTKGLQYYFVTKDKFRDSARDQIALWREPFFVIDVLPIRTPSAIEAITFYHQRLPFYNKYFTLFEPAKSIQLKPNRRMN
jgi:hypothetical protein